MGQRRLFTNHYFVIIGLALLAFCLSATLTAWLPVRATVHDEFSHLLAAETLCSGSLTLPTPRGVEHLESPHVNLKPTRHSAYPIGHGLALALGWGLLGEPIRGAWLLAAFLTATVTWALLSVLPLRWAALGGVLSAFHPGIAVYWNQTYFGGTLAAVGGALILGSMLRIAKKPQIVSGCWLGVGLLILANTRPYVSVLAAVLVMCLLLREWYRSKGVNRSKFLRGAVLPFFGIGALGVGFLLHHNETLTGDPFQLPYQLNSETYAAVPVFIFQDVPIAVDRPDSIDIYQRFRLEDYQSKNTLGGFFRLTLEWILRLGRFFLATGLLVLPLLGLRSAWRHSVVRGSVMLLALTGLALLPIKSVNPQYAAPAFALFCLVVMMSARELIAYKWMRWILAGVLVVYLASPFAVALARAVRTEDQPFHHRSQIGERLGQMDETHIVFVLYDETHDPLFEWVHNEADLDGSRVIWARSLGAGADRAFSQMYSGRRTWLLHADSKPDQIVPYIR